MTNWFKVFMPLSRLQFYPPKFIIRNPVVRIVERSFDEGFHVIVSVFNLHNLTEIRENLSSKEYPLFLAALRAAFKESVLAVMKAEDILNLHDHNSVGLTLIHRTENCRKTIAEMDGILFDIEEQVQRLMSGFSPELKRLSIRRGYMFLEKEPIVERSLNKAQHQAQAMAEQAKGKTHYDTLSAIRHMIQEENIRLLAQPIFDVETKSIKAYEVLTRGPANTELENPLTLFTLARQTGTLYEVEKLVMKKSFEQISQNESGQTVFINFSPLTIGRQEFISDIISSLKRFPKVSADQIVIEVTERERADDQKGFSENIKILKQLGFRLALDDTGAGYSNLNSIIEIMPDIIKVDRSVIQEIDQSPIKESMLKGILLIAKETGSTVVAEGIETAGEAMVLSKNKVDLAQGFFYAKPSNVRNIPLSPKNRKDLDKCTL
ncbi:EAL domain-containing protein [Bacillus massiliglaciei]|uniref:EAL domain-containing protein n=1 Tax=Bacillus massiliglaciei TaxID=1816693 RepID=UPI000A3E82F5|nr:EAL domain-containing protein [Bacillus massiliglaciei]